LIPKIKLVFSIILFSVFVSGCSSKHVVPRPLPTITFVPTIPSTNISVSNIALQTKIEAPSLSGYVFPGSIDPSRKYMFYLHGKIIEDQGLNAVSPDYGPYEYEAILEKLGGFGFVVISEQREKDANILSYTKKITGQIKSLLGSGVPSENITVVGASKGAGIAILVSNMVNTSGINYVLLGTCHIEDVQENIRNNIFLTGNVLSIFDSVDEYSGSCEKLFTFSEAKGLTNHKEIILHGGTGHGILYKPLDEWVHPVVDWANGKY
jgi:hypothetical protein